MLLRTQPYLDLINRLRTCAINTTDLEKRDRMREDMLGVISRSFNLSNAYICQHDFHNQVSIVRHNYVKRQSEMYGLMSEFDEIYHEYEMGQFVEWLHGDNSNPLIKYVSDMQNNSERQAYEQYGVERLIFVSLNYQDTTWGYLEIWDSHRNQNNHKTQINLLSQFADYISDTIRTVVG